MLAIDTNVLVRLITNDDKVQAKQATELFHKFTVYISKTVLLETEWVLRYTYGFKAPDILTAFTKLFGLERINIEDFNTSHNAILYYANNMDFADALHLASSEKCKQFVTFDKAFIKKANKINVPIQMSSPEEAS